MIELPKDAEGREIPLDTTVLYNENGDHFDVNRFTYSVVQTIPGLKWGVVFMDCVYDYCSSLYLAPPEPPDSWEALEADLDRNVFSARDACSYFGSCGDCADCRNKDTSMGCIAAMLKDIAKRIRKLRGESK